MSIVDICSQPNNTIWHEGKTFLVVFDNNNMQIADYDFFSGLKLIADNNNINIFIYDKDLVPGKWKFFGTKIVNKNGKQVEEKIQINGVKEGKSFIRKYDNKNPWKNKISIINKTFMEHVSATEREKRMGICRKCPLFISEDSTCSVNGNLVIETTKIKYEYCPEQKWGNEQESEEKLFAILQPEEPTDVALPKAINLEDQEIFENELEEYLKGL